MPCEHYKDALIEAANAGTAPSGELRGHLAGCAACRAAFAEEQTLFAEIDAGLHSAVNAEAPPSLLPRVRIGLDEIVAAQPRWNFGWTVAASAAFVSAVLFFAFAIRQNRFPLHPTESVTNQPATPKIAGSAQGPLVSAPPGKNGLFSTRPNARLVKNPARSELLVSSKSAPDVLVPRDDELLLASYAQQWSSRKRAPLVAGDAKQTTVAPLELPPIQIPELDVKPLAEGNSQ